MLTMSLDEFHAALKAQGLERNHWAFVCPMCKTVQSANDFLASGAAKDFLGAQKYLGFSCIGRFTAGLAPRPIADGAPCNWTLGGLFKTHELEVLTPDGKNHPHFMVATPEQAQAHAKQTPPVTCGQ